MHVYSCILKNGRYRKCFRANLFKIAEDNLAFTRDIVVDGVPDGILIDGFDVKVQLVFKEEAWMLKFQSALLLQVASTTRNKRPRYCTHTAEAKADCDDEYDALQEVPVDAEKLSSAPFFPTAPLKRVFGHQYRHEDTGASENSPPCDTFSDARSMSIFSGEPETVTITEAETRVQMLEDHTHDFFQGKNAEVAHIKDKAKCSSAEEKNVNNHLHLSRHLHEAFDGINTVPKKFPWFVLQYVRHDTVNVDCPKIGDDAVVAFPFKKRHRTTVQVHFYNEQSVNTYSKYLRAGSRRIDSLTYELEMYFEDAEKAKTFIDWKESKTRKRWSEA